MTTAQPNPPNVDGTVFEEGAVEIGRSYAQALLNVVSDQGQADLVLDELDELAGDVWGGQPDFAAMLSGGISDPERRDRMLVEVFGGRAHPTLLNLLRVLGRRDRLGLVPVVARLARDEWNRRNNRVPVSVRSAVPLDDGQRQALRERLRALTDGAEPIVEERVDPSLIGGLVVQVGDRLYDASVRHRLARLRDELLRGRMGDLRRRHDLVID